MDYRFASTSDIPALLALSGAPLAGEIDADSKERETLWWTRFGDDRRIVIFEDEQTLVASLVYKPSKAGFDLEEFITVGGGLVAAEAFRLLLDEILAPSAELAVVHPGDTPEAVQFWRSQGFEAGRVTLVSTDGLRRAAANEN